MTPRYRLRVCAAVPIVLILTAAGAAAQTPAAGGVLTGRVVDARDRTGLPGANVTALRLAADSLRTGAATDSVGAFRFAVVPGRYRVRVSSVGYTTVTREVNVPAGGAPVDLGVLQLRSDDVALRGVTVETEAARATVRGDTTAFNASAFRVQRDATTEDLVSKLPGVTVENGQVTAQGQQVRRVLVDGREFFGDDPSAALRNLPADVVSEIQVFDRQSDQSRFTGFDDGNRERTLNVVTRANRRTGRFGRINAGGGVDAPNPTDDGAAAPDPRARYTAGGNLNVFKGDRRVSVVGLLNNVNQQNFAFEDLLGASGGSEGRRSGGGGGAMTVVRMGGPGGGGGGMRFGGGSDFFVGDRGGINAVASLGLNYSDRLGKATVSGNYFGSRTANTTDGRSARDYFIPEGARYTETSDGRSTGYNHRLSGRVEWPLSARTELTFTPRVSLQTNDAASGLRGDAALGTGRTLTTNAYDATDLGLTANSNLLLRHRFPKAGRSVTGNVGLNLDGRTGDGELAVENTYFMADEATIDSVAAYRRATKNDQGGRTLSFNLAYTEPVGRYAQLQASYAPSFAASAADQDADLFDVATGGFTTPDPAFTSRLERDVQTHRGGLTLQYRRRQTTASVGLDAQAERLDVEQFGGRAYAVKRSFASVLPSASFRYQPSRTASLDLNYRARTDAPSATQLRDVYDDTNPLLVTTGNRDLRPSTDHRLNLQARAVRRGGTEVMAGFANLSVTQNYVATALLIPTADSLVAPGVTIGAGSQLSRPVNLGGYLSARTFLTYGRPLGVLRSNANVSAGLNLTRTPGLVNDLRNRADAASVDGRFGITSNISERFDFNTSYGLTYTDVTNTVRAARDQRYARHRVGLRLTARPRGGLVFTSDLNTSFYTGEPAGATTPTTSVLNAGLGYTFGPRDAVELRLSVNDLLNRNTNVNRTTQGAYVETTTSEALGRYVMLNLTYRLRAFGGAAPSGPGGPPRGAPVIIMREGGAPAPGR